MAVLKRWLRQHPLRLTRDTALFLGGMAGITYETVINSAERPSLLVLFAGMVGLPSFLPKKPPPSPPPSGPPPLPAQAES
jgi:hypothetical protein